MHGETRMVLGKSALFMIFRLEAVPESIVRRYFLQVPALLNLRFPGSRMPVGSTGSFKKQPTDEHRAYFGYCEYRVTFCVLARLAGTPKLGLAPLPNPLRVGHTTIIVG